MGVDVKRISDGIFNQLAEHFSLEVLPSGLLQVTTFPLVIMSPELIQESINHYENRAKSIRKNNGESLLSITRETIMLVFKIPMKTF